MQYLKIVLCVLLLIISITGCGSRNKNENSSVKTDSLSERSEETGSMQENNNKKVEEKLTTYNMKTKIKDVINDSVFGDYGRLIFPVDMSINKTMTLKNVEDILPWYSEINSEKTVAQNWLNNAVDFWKNNMR